MLHLMTPEHEDSLQRAPASLAIALFGEPKFQFSRRAILGIRREVVSQGQPNGTQITTAMQAVSIPQQMWAAIGGKGPGQECIG